MDPLLGELGRQLSTRAAIALVAPGGLYVAAAAVGYLLGHRHAFDFAALGSWLDQAAAAPASRTGGTILLAAAGLLAASALAGATAAAVGLLVQRSWSATGSGPVLRRMAVRRRHRWQRADRVAEQAVDAWLAKADDPERRAAARTALARRDAVGLVPAELPTWAGDRLRATDLRLRRRYGLDLPTAWPRLWLVLPEPARQELTTAQDRCAAAARLVAWGLLYLILAGFWWPALALAIPALAVSRHRIRRTVASYAALVDAAADLYARDLVRQLGLACPGQLTREIGETATAILQDADPER
jgi:hypothetical protein